MHYGLTTTQVRKLAYEFARVNPPSWDENKMAGKEWLDSYRRRNTNLSLRKPENTSAAWSYGFNKTAVNDFYENLEKILTKYTLSADRIYNFDESGINWVNLFRPKEVNSWHSKELFLLVTEGSIENSKSNQDDANLSDP